MADILQIMLPDGTTYNIKDNNALPLTGGQVTGPVTFGDSVSIDDLIAGNVIITGAFNAVQGIPYSMITDPPTIPDDTKVNVQTSTAKAYILGTTTTPTSTAQAVSSVADTSIYSQSSVLYGAAWNDYAEYREACANPGDCVIEVGDGTLRPSSRRLEAGASIVSDTYGFAIGRTLICDCPIAVSGRVLAKTYRNRNEYSAGDAVCAAPGGTIDIMTRDEIRDYPDRIVGIVSEIPNYETWGQNPVQVNGRIWIKVK